MGFISRHFDFYGKWYWTSIILYVVAINAQSVFFVSNKISIWWWWTFRIFIQFTCCNKCFNSQISDVKQELFTKKEILPVLSKLECFIMLVFCGWYKQGINTILHWMNSVNNGVQEGHGLMIHFFIILVALYLVNYLSRSVKIDMILCVDCMLTKRRK